MCIRDRAPTSASILLRRPASLPPTSRAASGSGRAGRGTSSTSPPTAPPASPACRMATGPRPCPIGSSTASRRRPTARISCAWSGRRRLPPMRKMPPIRPSLSSSTTSSSSSSRRRRTPTAPSASSPPRKAAPTSTRTWS